jgi:hypothetical protein
MDFLTTTITLASLPPNTLKANIHSVFQRFWRGQAHLRTPGQKARGCPRRTLHVYAKQPVRALGREIIAFRKDTNRDAEGATRSLGYYILGQ